MDDVGALTAEFTVTTTGSICQFITYPLLLHLLYKLFTCPKEV